MSIKPQFIGALLLLFSSTVIAQVSPIVQTTALGSFNCDHATPAFPDAWDTESAVSMTTFSAGGTQGRIMRLDTSGTTVWDRSYSGSFSLRLLHAREHDVPVAGANDAAVEAVGFMGSNNGLEGLKVWVDDAGDVVLSSALSGTNWSNVVILQSVSAGEHSLYIGYMKDVTNGNQMAFACLADASGSVSWTRTLDSPAAASVSTDFDAATHVTFHGGTTFIISGTANGEVQVGPRQVASLWSLELTGTTNWARIYNASPGNPGLSDCVPAGAVTDGQDIWQVVNQIRPGSGSGNGFSVVLLDYTTGIPNASGSRYVVLDPAQGLVPMRAMTVLDAGATDLAIAGFLEVPSCSFDVSCGLTPGDHPPFQMLFKKSPASGTSGVAGLEVYGVTSSLYGVSSTDDFRVFHNVDMPRYYTPEMMAELPPGITGRKLVGFERFAFGTGFHPELIWTDDAGLTACPSIPLDITHTTDVPGLLEDPSAGEAMLEWNSVGVESTMNQVVMAPCEADCDIDVTISYEVDCGDATFTALNSGATPEAELCFEWDFDHGGYSGIISGTGEANWTWPSTVTEAEVCLTVYCCSNTSSSQTFCITVTDIYSADCPCDPCTPFIRKRAIPLFENAVFEGFPPVLSPGGCNGGSGGHYSMRLWDFAPAWFGDCWDDRSAEWYLDGVLVETDACGSADGTHFGWASNGAHDVEVVLTDCTNPNCADTLETTFEMSNCILPSDLPFELIDFSMGMCGALQCQRAISPLMALGPCMEGEWIIDGISYPYTLSSLVHCFAWGHHEVTWRAWCVDHPDDVVENTKEFHCGPVIGPVFEWNPGLSAWFFSATGLAISGVAPADLTVEVTGLDVWGNPAFTSNFSAANGAFGPWQLPGGFGLAAAQVTYLFQGEEQGTMVHDLGWSQAETMMAASMPCDSLFTFDGMPDPGPWGAAQGTVPGTVVFDVFGWPVTMEEMQWNVGVGFNSCYAEPALGGWGSGDVMRLNNGALRFDFTGAGLNGLSFIYLDEGGDENLVINGMDLLGGAGEIGSLGYWSSGGLTVTESHMTTASGNEGTVYISGPIETLEVAGQEFWIDDLCFGSIPNGNNGDPDAFCAEDLDQDGSIGISDLLQLLAAYGTDCLE